MAGAAGAGTDQFRQRQGQTDVYKRQLYSHAKELGCNKIALGHHYDDVIETILMGMLYGGQVQTCLLYTSKIQGFHFFCVPESLQTMVDKQNKPDVHLSLIHISIPSMLPWQQAYWLMRSCVRDYRRNIGVEKRGKHGRAFQI